MAGLQLTEIQDLAYLGGFRVNFGGETLPNFCQKLIASIWSSLCQSKGLAIMADVASSLFKSTVFNIEKLDGMNFPFWKEKIYNVLIQKKQVKPIKLKGVKPKSMD